MVYVFPIDILSDSLIEPFEFFYIEYDIIAFPSSRIDFNPSDKVVIYIEDVNCKYLIFNFLISFFYFNIFV